MVQGVGFRPFIYNLALKYELNGYVCNSGSGVILVIDAIRERVDEFVKEIKLQAPPLSEIKSIKITSSLKSGFEDFKIKKSEITTKLTLEIPADISICKECQEELEDENNRRYNYPFISCTNCGPRFSIIKNLPYDRCYTSMDKFKMCFRCQEEYENPKDRRYHAQPIGCFECGPKLSLFDSNSKTISKDLIEQVCGFLADSKIVAIKGIGGYHLVCDATNDEAVKLLRDKKHRASKPFGVMLKDVDMVKSFANINAKEQELLQSNKRPIVLLNKNMDNALSDLVAPNINQIGIFLAYTPLHHLLLQKLNTPIVATSANISGIAVYGKFRG